MILKLNQRWKGNKQILQQYHHPTVCNLTLLDDLIREMVSPRTNIEKDLAALVIRSVDGLTLELLCILLAGILWR